MLTGCNEAFIIDEDKRNEILNNCLSEDERKRTEEIIRPILRGKDIKRYSYVDSGKYLINTHNGIKEKGIPPIDILDYPAIKNHLDSFGDVLVRRSDQGDTHYNLRNCAYLEEFTKPKLFYADICRELSFSYCEDVTYCSNSAYFISCAERDVIRYIERYLNHKLINWYYRTISVQLGAEAVRMFSIYVLHIPIPQPSNLDVYVSYELSEVEIRYIEAIER